MKGIKELFQKHKQNQEIKKIEKEERERINRMNSTTQELIVESEIRSTEPLEVFADTDELEKNKNFFSHTITSPLSSNINNTNEQTLVIDVNSKDIREIKRLNNKKRRSDESKDLKNSSPDNIIEVNDVSKIYVSGKNRATKVLDQVNLTIKRGEFIVLFGKSGSGKSTLLNIMSGLDRPTAGNVIVQDTNLPYLSNSQLTKFRRQHIAFIFQQYHLLNNITTFENIETGQILKKYSKEEDNSEEQNIDDQAQQVFDNESSTNQEQDVKTKSLLKKHKKEEVRQNIERMLEDFELTDVANKYPHQLSGGQQQRISILRALAKDADIIFADEPTGALDRKTGTIVMNILERINREQNKTVIMVSHDPEVAKYAQRIIYLKKGKIVSESTE